MTDQWNVELVIKQKDHLNSYNLTFQTEELARSYFNNECISDDWEEITLRYGSKVVDKVDKNE